MAEPATDEEIADCESYWEDSMGLSILARLKVEIAARQAAEREVERWKEIYPPID